MTETDKQRAYALYKLAGVDPVEVAARLEKERDELRDIIRRAKVEFFKDGPDGTICVNMLKVLQEAKE
jgi:hypothetical protein